MSIKVGSIVNVFWENLTSVMEAEVVSSPCATGDSWTLKRRNGDEVKIQTFCKMEETHIINEDKAF